MVYKIPMEDVKSLAKSFAQLESGKKYTHNNYTVFMKNTIFDHSSNFFTAKQNFNFEEYNFSQSTLEQVCHHLLWNILLKSIFI